MKAYTQEIKSLNMMMQSCGTMYMYNTAVLTRTSISADDEL